MYSSPEISSTYSLMLMKMGFRKKQRAERTLGMFWWIFGQRYVHPPGLGLSLEDPDWCIMDGWRSWSFWHLFWGLFRAGVLHIVFLLQDTLEYTSLGSHSILRHAIVCLLVGAGKCYYWRL